MNIVEKVKKFVKGECQKPSSKYGWEPFENHFVPMAKWSEKLSEQLGGDKEIILIAAWLHDIGSIMEGRENHHLTGIKIAEKKLVELDYPKNKIELVLKCILNHRGSRNDERKSLEEQIVAEADVISNFDNVEGIFKAAFIYENKNQKEARRDVLKKLERKWKQLHFEESREFLRPRLEAVRILFK